MSTATASDGATISYETTGAGPALILVHGITDSRHVWDPLVAALAEDFKVVAVDLRGHGASERRPPYDVGTMAADLDVVARAAHAIDPLVVGHSLGGAVVGIYAATYPARGVVNIDQPLRLSAFKDALESVEPLLRGDDASFRAVMEQIVSANYGPLSESERARIEAGRSLEQDVVLGVWDGVLERSAEELDALVQNTAAAITAPYLALHGSDPGEEYAEWLRATIARSTLEVWLDHGHFPHLVDPARFLDRIHDFAHELGAP